MSSDSDFEFKAPQYVDSFEEALEDYSEDSFFETQASSSRVIKTARRHSFSSKADGDWKTTECADKIPELTASNCPTMTPLQDRPVTRLASRINLKRKASPMPNSPPVKYCLRSESGYQFNKYVQKLHPKHNKPANDISQCITERKENEFATIEETDTSIQEDNVKTEGTTSDLWNIISKEITWTDKDKSEKPFEFLAKPGPAVERESPEKLLMRRPIGVYSKAKSINFNPEATFSDISYDDRRHSFLSLSVYERGKLMLEKKHEKISKIIAEESSRELREFHANPMPPISSPKVNISKIKNESSSRLVLRDIGNKELNTERRARERQIFNNYLKEKESILAAERKKAEEERIAMEKSIIAELRKDLVHKPLPLPPEYKKIP